MRAILTCVGKQSNKCEMLTVEPISSFRLKAGMTVEPQLVVAMLLNYQPSLALT